MCVNTANDRWRRSAKRTATDGAQTASATRFKLKNCSRFVERSFGEGRLLRLVKSSTDQRKSIGGGVYDVGGKIELAVKPGFYGVLVRGSHIGEVVHHQRAHVTRHELGCEELLSIPWPCRRQPPDDKHCQKKRSRKSQPVPGPLEERCCRTSSLSDVFLAVLGLNIVRRVGNFTSQ